MLTAADTSPTYSPVFFYTYNGMDYTQQTGYSSNPPAFEVGDKTGIFVDPSDPQKIYVPELKVAKFLSIIFAVIGGVFTLIAVIVFIISGRAKYIR